MPFDGFISYSHAADGRLAPAIQRGLHRLAKPWNRRRALWIFRDQTGLSVTPKLWTSIQEALDGSKHFVLLASPEAARSPWVNREIDHWLATKSPDSILPVVTDGKWRWDSGDFTPDSTAVPAALRGVFTEEPLYLDLRWARDDLQLSLQHVRFRDAIAQLAAPMHGISKDELEGEDVRQHRRARRLSAVAAVALVVLTLVASLTGVVAVRNADIARTALADSRQQQQVASAQRSTAERATEESQRQQENARVQQSRAQAAVAETARQEGLAREQRALAKDAAAEAKREQAVAARHRAAANRQRADAERQQALAKDASGEAARQKLNAERQLANARRQAELANQAETRAKEQQRIAEQHRELARQAERERKRQEQLAREAAAEARAAAEEARKQREEVALQQRIAINRRLIGRARAMLTDDPKKALMLGVAAQRLHSDAPTRDQLSHLAMSTHYLGAIGDAIDVESVTGQAVATVGADGTVSMWDTVNPANPVRLAQLPTGGPADKKVAASGDGQTLAVVDGSSEALLWNVTDPARPVRRAALTDTAGIVTVTFSPDGHTIATSNRDKNTTLWDLTGETPAALAVLPGAYPLKFGPAGRMAVSSGASVRVWDLTDVAHPVQGATLTPPFGTPPVDADIEVNPMLPLVAVELNRSSVWLWDLTNPAGPLASQLAGGDTGDLSSFEFSPDGRTLAFGSTTGTTELKSVDDDTWQTLSTRVATVTAAGGPVRSMAFSRDGRTLLTAGFRQTATLWNIKGRFARDAIATLPGPYPATIVGLAFRPDGRSLIAGGRDGTAVPWDLTDPAKPVRRDLLPMLSGTVESVTFSRDGRTAAATGSDKTVTLIDMTRPGEPALLATIKEDGDVVKAVTFSPDGRTLAIGRRGGMTTLWELTDRRRPTRLAALALRPALSAIAFGPDGRTMAAGEGPNLSMWDVSDRSAPVRLTTVVLADYISSTAGALTFSPDGRTLAAGTEQFATVVLWDVADPAHPVQTAIIADHTGAVNWVGFGPDSHTLATASRDNAMMLWDIADAASPVRFATIKTVELESYNAAFSPDGRTLAAGGAYGGTATNVTLWDATVPDDLAADPARSACAITGRGLNPDEWAGYIPELPYRSTC
jgi:WD40 repeat protein